MNWELANGVYISDPTDLGFYTISGRPSKGWKAWLHREDKDSVIICMLSDLECAQRTVEAYDRQAKPNTVHKTARRYLS